MNELKDLPNVGKVLLKKLNEIGVETPEDLKKIGVEEAFIKIRLQDPSACIRMLYGLQGAHDKIPDRALPQEKKAELRQFFKTL